MFIQRLYIAQRFLCILFETFIWAWASRHVTFMLLQSNEYCYNR